MLSSVFKVSSLFAVALFFSACSGDKGVGSVNVMMLSSAPGHCQFQITPHQIDTLNSLTEMRGALGQVVTSSQILTDSALEDRLGFRAMSLRFIYSGGTYTPADYPSLYAATLYGSVEAVYKKFAAASTYSDMMTLVPNLAESYYVYQAQLDDGEDVMYDNGMYTNVEVGNATYNYILALPTSTEVTDVPLPINPFIVSHEATHMVSNFLWRDKFSTRETSARNVLGALDEGFSDYVGFMITGDPGGFECTFPGEGRDLSVMKTFSSIGYSTSDADFPVHDGGAVWAAAQYFIGAQVGHENNLRALVEMFRNLPACAGNNPSFARVNQCHVQALGGSGSVASQIYSQAFGGAQ